MGRLFEDIREHVDSGRYLLTRHAVERLRQRGIMSWQAVDGLADGVLLRKRPDNLPFPCVEVREMLPDGEEFKAVWSLAEEAGVAMLVTVHFFDW